MASYPRDKGSVVRWPCPWLCLCRGPNQRTFTGFEASGQPQLLPQANSSFQDGAKKGMEVKLVQPKVKLLGDGKDGDVLFLINGV